MDLLLTQYPGEIKNLIDSYEQSVVSLTEDECINLTRMTRRVRHVRTLALTQRRSLSKILLKF
jgi:hypothetical protein